MSEVTLTDVEKVYPNGFKAVHGINLQVKNGEFMVLIGPSGCAKSTTLRMIAGLETITNGEIRIGGTVVNNLPPYKRGIAMVFQNYALYPHMRVKKNLSFGLRLARHPKETIETAVQDVSLELAIEQLLKRYPKELSGGQAQRVAVGRALIKKPQVFLFDEPLSNLDAERRHYFWMSLDAAFQKGVNTIFFIDHWTGMGIKNDKDFRILNTMRVYTENFQDKLPEVEFKQIDIYENNSPREFFQKQIEGILREKR